MHTLALAEALARAGHDVTVWTLARGGDTRLLPARRRRGDRPAGARPGGRGRDGRGADPALDRRCSAAAFERDRYDVVHAQDCLTANAVGARGVRASVAHRAPPRRVHDAGARRLPRAGAGASPASLRLRVGGGGGRGAARAGGRSPAVIPNGVDAARFAARGRVRGGRSRGARGTGRYVLAVGGIEPRKGTLDLRRGDGAAAPEPPDVPLVVAGGGHAVRLPRLPRRGVRARRVAGRRARGARPGRRRRAARRWWRAPRCSRSRRRRRASGWRRWRRSRPGSRS